MTKNQAYLLSENKEIHEKFLGYTKKISDIVGSTMGGKGKQVLIHTNINRVRITTDGITVLRSLNPVDEIEEAALALQREVSDKTNFMNGDFSSGSAWLFAKFVLGEVTFKKSDDDLIQKIVEMVEKRAMPVEKEEDLINVATISCKDRKLGELIGKMSWQLNDTSTTVIKYASENENRYDIIEGLSTIGVYTSENFYVQRRETLRKPKIIVIDDEITSFKQLMPLYIQIQQHDPAKEGQYVIIARNFSQEVTESVLKSREKAYDIKLLMLNSAAGQLKETMKNIAIVSGATLLGEGTAFPVTRKQDTSPLLKPGLMGTVKEFIIDMSKGDVIFTPEYENENVQEQVMDRVAYFQEIIDKPETTPTDVDKYRKLVSQLNGKIAYLYISGDTPAEMEHVALTAEDAVNACKSAKEMGYVAGGGVTLRDIADEIVSESSENLPIANVLKSLYTKILENAKIAPERDLAPNWGYNAVTEELGNMIDMEIIDPAKGIIFGLKTAYSMAKQVNNSSTLVINYTPEQYK